MGMLSMKSFVIIGKKALCGTPRCPYPAFSLLNTQSVRYFAQAKVKKDDKKGNIKDKEAAPKEKKKTGGNVQKKKKVVNEHQGFIDAIYHFLHSSEDARR